MGSPSLTIRAYEAHRDFDVLSDIWFEASLRAHGFLGEDRLRAHRVLVETKYLPQAETWVACKDGVPAGFIGLLVDYVGALFVAPHWQRHGIGQALVDHALHLKGRLTLEVYTANAQALAFYRGLGFRELGRRDHDDHGLPFETARMLLAG